MIPSDRVGHDKWIFSSFTYESVHVVAFEQFTWYILSYSSDLVMIKCKTFCSYCYMQLLCADATHCVTRNIPPNIEVNLIMLIPSLLIACTNSFRKLQWYAVKSWEDSLIAKHSMQWSLPKITQAKPHYNHIWSPKTKLHVQWKRFFSVYNSQL